MGCGCVRALKALCGAGLEAITDGVAMPLAELWEPFSDRASAEVG